MTIQKAIKILDWWIDQKKQVLEKFQEEWNNSDDSYGVEKAMLGSDRIVISNLKTIKKELDPHCKHPKNMRDRTADGQWYCMNCNFDL